MTIVSHFPPYVPYTLPEMADVPAPVVGDNGKALTYRSSLNDFVFTSFEAAGAMDAHVGGANPHTQYLLATSYTADDVLAKLLTVDINASGLNATTLQGLSPSAFDAAGLAAAAASGAAMALATHAGVTSGVHGIAAFGATLNATVDRAAAQSALALVPGTNVQAQNANLAAIAGLTTAANKVEYWTGSGVAALADFTSYGRGLVASANVAATGLLAADGSVVGATGGAQTFTNGVITGKVYPPANSTNAWGLYRANGTTQDFFYDSTNGRFGIGISPTLYQLQFVDGASIGGPNGQWRIYSNGNGYLSLWSNNLSPTPDIQMKSNGEMTFTSNVAAGANADAIIYNNRLGAVNSARFLVAYQAAGTTLSGMFASGGGYFSGATGVGVASPVALLDIAASTTARASLRIRSGARPTVTAGNPNDGEIWYDGTHVYMRIAGADKQLDN